MSNQEASAFRLVVTLALTGLLSGLVLVGVFLVTEPRIIRNQAEAMQRAIFTVLPGTVTTEAYQLSEGRLERFVSDDGSIPKGEAVFAGYGENGEFVGWAIPGEGPGYADTITLIYGFDPARRAIVGMLVLTSKETPGLGDKIITDDEFLQNFAELLVEPEVVGVKVAEKPRPSNEVDTITGATISSQAVVSILNKSNRQWLPILDQLPEPEQAAGEVTDDDTPEGS